MQKVTYCLPPGRAGRPRQTLRLKCFKMLVCEFLLEVLLKSADFEPLLAQLGQIPILGIWAQERPVPPYCLAWAQKVLCCLP